MIRRRQQVVMLAERQAAGVPWYHEAYEGIVETPYSWPIQSQLTDARELARQLPAAARGHDGRRCS